MRHLHCSGRFDGKGGFILAESMSGIIFYLVMLAAAGILIAFLFRSSNLSSAEQSLSSLRLQVKQLYAGSGDYSGLDTDLAVRAGVVPATMIRSDGTVKNAWNGAVTISAGSDTSTFVISFAGVPKDAAVKLATYQTGSWVDVSVNSTSVGSSGNMVSAVSAQVADTNTVAFTSN